MLSGSNFGNKLPAEPVDFWDFEEGSSGSDLSRLDWEIWDEGNPDKRAEYDSSKAYSGTLSGLINPHFDQFLPFGTNGPISRRFSSTLPSSRKFYLSFNSYKEEQSEGNSRSKWFRIGSDVQNLPELKFAYNSQSSGTLDALDINGQQACPKGVNYFSSQHLQWVRNDIYFYAGTPDAADGFYEYREYNKGKNIISASDTSCRVLKTDSGGGGTKVQEVNRVRLGAELWRRHWVDNVYLDITPARVEICDAGSWAARTHCEIQIPHTVWNNTSISITVNQGRFQDGESAHLFVIDENNRVSNSLTVSFQDGDLPGDAAAPAAPEALRLDD